MQGTLKTAPHTRLIYTLAYGVLLVCLGFWLVSTKEQITVEIQAPQDEARALPVYAQYAVTQTLVLSRPAVISRLEVPLYAPQHATGVVVTLRQGEQVLDEWEYQAITNAASSMIANFELKPSRLLEGQLAVRITGTDTVREKALRVFAESADEAYPDGNYRIAGNDKKGDIALRVYEQKNRFALLKEAWGSSPLPVLIKTGQVVLTALVVAAFPWARVWKAVRRLYQVPAPR